MSKVLITGADGQLGSELQKLMKELSIEFVAANKQSLDVTNVSMAKKYIYEINPDYIFHCAAYTAVDKAEDEGKEVNWAVNALGTEIISKLANEIGAVIVYISTDYVFDGNSNKKYTETDSTNPMNEYGKAKLAGEQAVEEYCKNYYIVRTSWVFGQYGNNFMKTMLNLSESKQQLTVVNDQFGRPTWTRTLAEFIVHLYKTKPECGIYHLSNDQSCSWFEFATEILKDTNTQVLPILSEEYPQKAYRPKHSIMDLTKVKATGFTPINWKEALNKINEY